MNQITRIRPTVGLLLVWALFGAAASPTPAQEPASPSPAEQAGDADPEAAPPGEGPAAEQPTEKKQELDLSSPRATMRVFLLAVQDAQGARPERISDAVRCMDVSELDAEGDERAVRSRSLAVRLFAIVDQLGVTLDDIPETLDPAITFYSFYRTQAAEPEEDADWERAAVESGVAEVTPPEETAAAPEIRLALNAETGEWRFTPRTLAAIPELEKRILKAAAPEPPAAPDVQAARSSARATMRTFLDEMNADPPNREAAVQCLDSTGKDSAAWNVRGPDAADKLKFIMDRIEVVVLTEIPDQPDAAPYIWYTSDTGNIAIARIAEGELAGEWRFTPQTLSTLDGLYKEFEGKPILDELVAAGVQDQLPWHIRWQQHLPNSLKTERLSLEWWQWLALIALLVMGWGIKILSAEILSLALAAGLKRRNIVIDGQRRRRSLRSSGAVCMVIAWIVAIRYLDLSEDWLTPLANALDFALALAIGWAAYRLVDLVSQTVLDDRDVQLTEFDEVVLPMLRKILRVVVVLVVVLFVCEWMGWDPKTLFGALGIGGVAVAFAAKDSLGNFFGSLTVVFDRPFRIGDWIAVGKHDGTVERVGFRSTRLRTFYNSVVTIPNSQVANTLVDNYGQRRYRRIKMMLSVTYSTSPDTLDAFCEGIRELIRLHPYTRKDYYHVYFNVLSPSSLDILLYCFVETPDWSTELRERHRLLVDILRLAERMGVEWAFPTRTVWLEQQEQAARGKAAPDSAEPLDLGLSTAASVFEQAYGPAPPPRGPVVIDRTPLSKRQDNP